MPSAEFDPLTDALIPPADESVQARKVRVALERDAKRISDAIDEELRAERNALSKVNPLDKPVKVLLLGQSEAGKSTTLKNFQLTFAPRTFEAERLAWVSVIYMNVIRSVQAILAVLDASRSYAALPLSQLEQLRSHIARAEALLMRRLGEDFFVRPERGWKMLFRGRPVGGEEGLRGPDEGVVLTLAACRVGINHLWSSAELRILLLDWGVELEQSPGFFLDDLDRILDIGYVPTDEDIVRARLRTVGLQEHKFRFDSGNAKGKEWWIYDVGGSRPQRAKWFSYFESMDAVMFLVPINCFDEYLEEDEDVNRLEDSFALWKTICESPLLQNVELILFLNKIDLLKRKLNTGTSFSRYVKTYKGDPHDFDAVCKYLRHCFKEIQQRFSKRERKYHAYLTCATDTRATIKTLDVVRLKIMQDHFQHAALM